MNKLSIRKIALIGLGFSLAGVVVYLSLMTAKVVSGVSVTVDTPDYVVRLRVLDAGAGDAREIAKEIRPYLEPDFEVRIVETSVFEVRDLPRSFIITHESDKNTAEMLSERLGLNPNEVIYKSLTYNNTQASATIVAGLDFDSLLSLVSLQEN